MTKTRLRRGPKPRDPSRLRTHCVSVRLSPEELAWLDRARKRAGMWRGEYLRHAAMGRPMPRAIPAVNREAWMGLGRLAADFHRLVSARQAGEVHPQGKLAEIFPNVVLTMGPTLDVMGRGHQAPRAMATSFMPVAIFGIELASDLPRCRKVVVGAIESNDWHGAPQIQGIARSARKGEDKDDKIRKANGSISPGPERGCSRGQGKDHQDPS